MSWNQSKVAPDGTHHCVDGAPMYSSRFVHVQKFHEPGLAPVLDEQGAYHIDARGLAAYSRRFLRTFGFYESRAAVEDESGWMHISPTGFPIGTLRFAWCGNFQGGRCSVRSKDGGYYHVKHDGAAAYAPRYLYAGDYREESAVVRSADTALCTHIGITGELIHGRWFEDLGVFHKGYACARDTDGWFHIRADGTPAYSRRFADLEPFYNGAAAARTSEGERVIVDPTGCSLHRLGFQASRPSELRRAVSVLVGGNICAGKSTLAAGLARHLGLPLSSIDAKRRLLADGTAAGELRAWSAFVGVAQASHAKILECTGSGPMVHLLAKALVDGGCRVVVIWLDTPVKICQSRARERQWDVPYPDFGVSMDAVILGLQDKLQHDFGQSGVWRRFRTIRLEGERSAERLLHAALGKLRPEMEMTADEQDQASR